MLLIPSEAYSATLPLTDDNTTLHPDVLDFSLTEGVLSAHPDEAIALYSGWLTRLPKLWQAVLSFIPDNPWVTYHNTSHKPLLLSLLVVTDPEIQHLNQTFRQKDSATDVLTFTLLNDSTTLEAAQALPELNLGEIYVSLPWAINDVCKQIDKSEILSSNFWSPITLFLEERFVHGCLHLLGVHHNTMTDYNKVITLQQQVRDVVR